MRDIARPFKAVNFGWVSKQHEIPTIDEIKTALANHGALVVAVRVTPNMVRFLRRKAHGEVFDESDNRQINHAVTLVGWDEDKKAWLIKNSWGTNISETRDSFTSNTRLIASDLRLNGLMLRMRDFQCPLYQSELS